MDQLIKIPGVNGGNPFEMKEMPIGAKRALMKYEADHIQTLPTKDELDSLKEKAKTCSKGEKWEELGKINQRLHECLYLVNDYRYGRYILSIAWAVRGQFHGPNDRNIEELKTHLNETLSEKDAENIMEKINALNGIEEKKAKGLPKDEIEKN